jgi:hypothetical protein
VAAAPAKFRQPRKIAPVGRKRVRAQAALMREVRYEFIDPFALAGLHDQRINA